MCGEKAALDAKADKTAGSPPRVRGKVGTAGVAAGAFGITPACAGKSLISSGANVIARDHPRVCGEKLDIR